VTGFRDIQNGWIISGQPSYVTIRRSVFQTQGDFGGLIPAEKKNLLKLEMWY